jgi:hypothetical protein
MELSTKNGSRPANNFITQEEIEQRYPALWQLAKEKEANWSPEFLDAIRKLKEERRKSLL